MNREERAKQFMPFDALKGLHEELRCREKKMLREEKRVLFEEEAEKLSSRLARLTVGNRVEAVFYENGYYLTISGKVDSINRQFGFLTVDGRRVYFVDLYRLCFR